LSIVREEEEEEEDVSASSSADGVEDDFLLRVGNRGEGEFDEVDCSGEGVDVLVELFVKTSQVDCSFVKITM
jgi:hypothetical protein